MLSAIRRWISGYLWIWSSDTETENSFEIITPIFHNQSISGTISNTSPAVTNKHTRKYEYITYKCAVENLSKSSECHLNEKKFLDKDDKKTQFFIDGIQKEISKHIPPSSVKDIKLRGRKAKSFTAWLLLHENSEPLKIDESFLQNVSRYSNPKITAVTLLNSPEEERGFRISLDENKCRLYEVVNGTYKIQFNWKSNNKNCSIAVTISSNDAVTCSDISENLTNEALQGNKDVKIRIGAFRNQEMTLAELVYQDDLLFEGSIVRNLLVNKKEKSALT